MKKLCMIAVVLACAGVASANGITSGAWEDDASWWDGVAPAASSTEVVYVGPGGAIGGNLVTVTSDMPQINNELHISGTTLDITGTLNVENGFIWAGAYGDSVINVHDDAYFRVGPDVFALDGRSYSTAINLSETGFMETFWPHFYEGNGLQVSLTDDATWKTWGMWFQDSSTVLPTIGGDYNIDISGTATFMVGNSWWSEADAINAIASGFITGTNLQVYTSEDTFYTVVQSVPEPMTMSLLGLGSLIVIRRKRA